MSDLVVDAKESGKGAVFAGLLKTHFRRHWVSYVLSAILLHIIGANYRVALNMTESLPYKVAVVHLGEAPRKGELAAIKMEHLPRYGDVMVNKYIKGTPGDVVEARDREFFINGASVGTAKKLSKKGEPLEMNVAGTIPEGQYWIYAPHKDSYDSRYKEVGLVKRDQIVGRVYPIF